MQYEITRATEDATLAIMAIEKDNPYQGKCQSLAEAAYWAGRMDATTEINCYFVSAEEAKTCKLGPAICVPEVEALLKCNQRTWEARYEG